MCSSMREAMALGSLLSCFCADGRMRTVSVVLRKVAPVTLKGPIGSVAKTVLGTTGLGASLGRLVPYAGFVITMYQINDFAIHKLIDDVPADDKERYLDALGTAF